MTDIATQFNKQNEADIFNENTMELPPRPSEYDGLTFKNTLTMGGWGQLTSGMYTIKGGFERSGYKAWGANGQGELIDRNVAWDTSDMERYMIVSIVPTYLDQDYSTTDQDRIEMEMGAYPFREMDWEPMSVKDLEKMETPNPYVQVGSDNAISLAASSMVLIGAGLSMF